MTPACVLVDIYLEASAQRIRQVVRIAGRIAHFTGSARAAVAGIAALAEACPRLVRMVLAYPSGVVAKFAFPRRRHGNSLSVDFR